MGLRIGPTTPNVIVSQSIVYTDEWQRPAEWMPMPDITPGEQKIATLYGVYENDYNQMSVRFITSPSNGTIDWGDGVSESIGNTARKDHVYDYSSLTGSVYQDEWGDNYKQVMIYISGSGGTTNYIEFPSSAAYNSPGSRNILDYTFSWDGNTYLNTIQNMPKCQRFRYLASNLGVNVNSYYSGDFVNLRYLELPSGSSITSAQSLFQTLGPVTNAPDLYLSNTGTSLIMFAYAKFKKWGNVTIDSSTNFTQMFYLSAVQEIGGVTGSACTNASSMVQACYSLQKIGTLHLPALQNMTSMFNSCYALQEIVFTDCSVVTTTTNAFSSCQSLRSLRMPGIATSFTIASCALQRDALVALFNDLATTTATITITGNPGVPDLSAADLAIATDKGWTVTS